jgi:hypothetical protein
MDGLAQAIAALKAENKRLEQKLQNVRVAIAALQEITNSQHRMASRRSRVMTATGRRRIAAAQRARWAKWRKQKTA